jgi:serine/threonine-protein kinase HipA
MSREILVYADWETITDGPKLMGILRSTESRGREIFSFNYNERWLARKDRLLLDPDLRFFEGDQYLNEERPNFGIFLDSAPDRWGRVLMQRREAARAIDEGRARRTLLESDYLLGVHDSQRLGGLRFKAEENGPFLDHQFNKTAPPSTSLRELQRASWHYQDPDADSANLSEWISLLIAPGSSLGGARPKAGLQYPNGDLWIAKFPGRNDLRDMGAWERVVWELGKEVGLDLPDSECLDLDGAHRTFLVRRFDRVLGSKATVRLHFASAMTLLGHSDGDDHRSGAGYLELCDWISNFGAQPSADLPELWNRIVFSMFVSNTDDHLRNHGFLLTPKGWVLSPAYDVNAEPEGVRTGLSLNVNEDDNRLDTDLALEVAEYFRVTSPTARDTITKIHTTVSNWRAVAKRMKIGRAEIELMEPAFALSD